jgi:membrane protease YdiL (CAAX protease family)
VRQALAKRTFVWLAVVVSIAAVMVLGNVPELPWQAYGGFAIVLLVVWAAVILRLRRIRRLPVEHPKEIAVMKTDSSVSSRPAFSAPRKALLKRPLFSYFILAYVIKFGFLIPYTLAAWGIISGDWSIAFVVATFGPFVAGIVMVFLTEGRQGIGRIQRSIRGWRVGFPLLAFVFTGIPALVMLGVCVLPGSLSGFLGFSPVLLLTYPLTYFAVWFGGGGLNEEVGWRGFALPRMQSMYGPLWGTLVLGVVHCFWHLEEFLTPAQGGGPGTGWTPFVVNLPIFLILVLSFNIIMTWIFNYTRGSLFAAISAHASVDTPQAVLIPLFPAVGTLTLLAGTAIPLGALAVIIVVLTRGRLGYTQANPRH